MGILKIVVLALVWALGFTIGCNVNDGGGEVVRYDTSKYDSLLVVLEKERQSHKQEYEKLIKHEEELDSVVDALLFRSGRNRPSFESVESRGVDTGRYSFSSVITSFRAVEHRYHLDDSAYWAVRQSEIRDSLERVFSTR